MCVCECKQVHKGKEESQGSITEGVQHKVLKSTRNCDHFTADFL